MTNISNVELGNNLQSVFDRLISSAATGKAQDFVVKLYNQILARGDEWLQDNKDALAIRHDADWYDSFAPVQDNRLWYIAQWQIALNK
jgi:hypothetical protein